MRRALILLCALIASALLPARASAAQACVWIVELAQDDGEHMFALNISVDAPTSVAVRFQGPNFTSGSMGGDMIDLTPGEAKDIDDDGFDVGPGDELRFNVRLFDRPLATLDEMENPAGKPLAVFDFHRKVGADERAPPADLAVKQCKRLG
jgi:hypothetical protein